jgi:hypothetical protein
LVEWGAGLEKEAADARASRIVVDAAVGGGGAREQRARARARPHFFRTPLLKTHG